MAAIADDPFDRLARAVRRIADETRGRPRTGTAHDDADGVTGTFATDGAIGFDPVPLLAALSERGARVVVMGQVAGILHGSEELTGDLDLLWDGEPSQAPRLADAFAAVGARLRDADGAPVPCTATSFGLPKVLFDGPTASGDCCTPKLPWGELDIGAILANACTATGPSGVTVHYVAAEDLLVMRRAVGRPKDLRRADELARLLASG